MKFLLSLKLSMIKGVIRLKLGKMFEANFFGNLFKKLIGIEPKTHKIYVYPYLQTLRFNIVCGSLNCRSSLPSGLDISSIDN